MCWTVDKDFGWSYGEEAGGCFSCPGASRGRDSGVGDCVRDELWGRGFGAGGLAFSHPHPDLGGVGDAGPEGVGRCWEREPEAGGLGSCYSDGGGNHRGSSCVGGGAGAGGPGSSFCPDGQEDRFSFADGSSV